MILCFCPQVLFDTTDASLCIYPYIMSVGLCLVQLSLEGHNNTNTYHLQLCSKTVLLKIGLGLR